MSGNIVSCQNTVVILGKREDKTSCLVKRLDKTRAGLVSGVTIISYYFPFKFKCKLDEVGKNDRFIGLT